MRKLIILMFLLFLSINVVSAENNKRLPGNSIADYTLQKDTIMPAYIAASIKTQGCKNLSILTTQLTKKPEIGIDKNKRYYAKTPWEETWIINACGKNVYVPIIFTQNTKGTTYSIKQSEVYTK